MQLYTDSFKDFTRNPMPSIEQKNAERAERAKQVAAYIGNGGQITVLPTMLRAESYDGE